jgi:hypothetical protein
VDRRPEPRDRRVQVLLHQLSVFIGKVFVSVNF